MAKAPLGFRQKLYYRFEYMLISAVLGLLSVLPFAPRRRVAGWVFSRLVAPLARYDRRIRANLADVRPELSAQEVEAHVRDVPYNVGQTLSELFSPKDLAQMARQTALSGPGLAALRTAQAERRPSILVSGHYGNYDIIRSALIQEGLAIGGFYRPMNNPYFNDVYVKTISQIGTPLFPRGREGMSKMVRFLKSGGTLAILIDQRMGNGVDASFFGKRASTATSVADLAIKYNAVVVPCYATRHAEGFEANFEAPIEHGAPMEMIQALNDSLEAQVRQNSTQWFWIHRRWK